MLLEFAADSGILPLAIANKPELGPILGWYYDEYNSIARDRRTDQGYPIAISTTDIAAYCDFFGVEDKYEFYKYMKMIDDIYLEEWYKRQKAKDAKK
jgi:hypothetical protein